MSVKAITWAFEQPLGGNEKCVLLALADYARDDGACWPAQETVARKAYISERTVRRIMSKLEEEGYIRREHRYRDGLRIADLTVLALPDRSAALPDNAGQTYRTPVSGEPSTEPSEPSVGRARAREAVMKIAGRRVDPAVWSRTTAALDEFNAQTGRSLGAVTGGGQPSESAKRIYQRLAAWPDLAPSQIADVITRTLASKWWGDGPASIGVVFGPNVFEENLTRPALASSRRRDGDDGHDAERLRSMRLRMAAPVVAA